LSTRREEDVRLRVLQFFNADPDHFDVVFCANATAAMKIVAEAFSAHPSGFSYKYHGDSHTSLIGIRELSNGAQCLFADVNVEGWLEAPPQGEGLGLFGWPAQSNFSGRRLPLNWSGELRSSRWNYYSLLDAASLLTTSPLDLSDTSAAPDFTALSFYKIFGFPDLGALIVRRDSCSILRKRRYFGGGTVDSLVATKTDFVARKNDSPHSYLEDGTIAFHSIIALDTAMSAYERLYGNPLNVSRHAFALGKLMHELLLGLRHGNGRKVCTMYGGGDFSSRSTQGPLIAFNLQKADGSWIGYAEVEKLASIKNIHIRVGGMCNPGGIEGYVGLRTWEIEQNYAAGHKCSDDNDIMNGKPTGAVRVSLGAMSTADDVLSLVKFVDEFYVEKNAHADMRLEMTVDTGSEFQVQSLIICVSLVRLASSVSTANATSDPIKSCGGFKIPAGLPWEVRPHGLAWDREWCLVHLGTHRALSQKVYIFLV
jgi:molybdenum cofactor sulfurtransferase